MGWFDEQIKQRKLSDQEVFEDSFMHVASAVLGGNVGGQLASGRQIAKFAVDEILVYFHCKPVEIPKSITDLDEQLEYAFRPHGIMRRAIRLEEGWYKDSFGAILAFTKEDGHAVALLPSGFSGYTFTDPKTGKKTKLNRETAKLFQDDGLCFYRSLPLKELGIPDLMLFIKDCISSSDVILIVIMTAVVMLVGMIGPALYKILTGPVLASGNINALIGIAVFMVSVNLSSMLLSAVKSLYMSRIQVKTSVSVEAAVMMRVLSLPAKFFRKYSSGELAQRAGSVNSLCGMLMNGVFSTGLTSLMSLMYITQIFSFAPALVIPSVAIILLTVVLSAVTALMQINISRKQMELGSKESGMSYALLNGIQKIKLSGAEKRAFARWADLYAQQAEYQYNPPTFLKVNSVITTAVSLAGNIILYYLAVKNNIGQSGYYAFNASYGMVMGAFSAMAGIVLNVASARPIMEMAEPILKEIPETAEGKRVLTDIRGNIEFSNVYFRYEENMPYVVNNLSLKIKRGEYIAIVGKTGCGKSTLIRLLLGFEKPEKGAVYFDGMDISTIDLRSLRRKIGTVSQDGSLFSGDIFSNITIAAPQLTLAEAWEAAETAGIAEDIRRMPMGMNTMISEGGGGISGGQKQRIMIARAIAPKPKVLIFDEATSALDNKTQKKVSDALDALKCTRIVVAHRLSTIRHCDRILVFDGGKIIEDGTYDELIAQNGFFAELVERQRLDTGSQEKKEENKTESAA